MENKSEIIKIRVTADEKKAITDKAKNAGMTMSKYIRTSAMGKKVADYSNLLSLVREINYIGNNINQATKIMNTYHAFDGADYDYLYNEFLKLKKVLDGYISEELKNGGS